MRYLTGSNLFFTKFDDFKSKDTDYIVLVEQPKRFNNFRQTSSGYQCIFEWRKMTAQEFVDFTLNHSKPTMQVIKFLNKDFCNAIGFTLTHLKQLEKLFNELDDKHKYAKVIYDSYVANNKFTLTNEQLENAYSEYKKYRK